MRKAEKRKRLVEKKYAPKMLELAQMAKAALVELIELEKIAQAEANSKFAVFSATTHSLRDALGFITNTCQIAQSLTQKHNCITVPSAEYLCMVGDIANEEVNESR
jgi:hypothetical protein